ncbi:EamA family transporter RarD [Croceicoccus ponticola]|uniref:EamA family transporter RarD n=1 Tax=Croceicoccus ponticola TaxID=2217664 RepID=A0A437H1N6_9SPHN|nr:EamA family transporter RarD [Croceicoccus ponticola]RVQ69551.1 EamA family transporter RarD [Croceicoccus ponticola]
MTSVAEKKSHGLPYALGAYALWGTMPLYLVMLNGVDPFRLVAWRIVWTIPVCLMALAAIGGFAKLHAAFANRRALALLLLSSLLITLNWIVYVVAVQAGHFYAASLGYYINPLVNVLLGTIFLRERLSRLQWLAVAIAASGIAVLAIEAREMLVISLTLALSFGFYGLLRKRVAVDALPGLTVEVLLLTIPAIVALMFVPQGVRDFGDGWSLSFLLVGAGLMTGVPLLLFAVAARRMTYSALGFVQFLAPTMVFLQGLFLFGENLKPVQAICFVLIWTAIAIFCADMLMRMRRNAQPQFHQQPQPQD